MARITLDVPKDKMQSFIQAILDVGINRQGIHSRIYNLETIRKKSPAFSLRKIASSFILFDWEFFRNELEYE